MTEVRQGPTPRVRFREVSVKREWTVLTNSQIRNKIETSISKGLTYSMGPPGYPFSNIIP